MWYTQLVFAYYRTYHLPINWVPRIVSLADVTQMLHTVGVVELSTATQNYEFAYGTEQEWWEAQWTDAARFPLEGMPPAVLKQFKAEVIARLVAMKQADWLHAWRKAGAVVGIKPLVDHGQ